MLTEGAGGDGPGGLFTQGALCDPVLSPSRRANPAVSLLCRRPKAAGWITYRKRSVLDPGPPLPFARNPNTYSEGG
jgi:hypothetical protein